MSNARIAKPALLITLGWRMLSMFGGHGNGFARFVTWVSFGGLALGVMVLTLVVTVMNGFDAELKNRLLRAIPHVTVRDGDQNQALQKHLTGAVAVRATNRYFTGVGAISAGGDVQPVAIYGLDESASESVAGLAAALTQGSFADLYANPNGVIIGSPLARYLDLQVGDPVMMIGVQVHDNIARPKLMRFTMIGTFELGAEPDYELVVVNFHHLERSDLKMMGAVGLQVQLLDPLLADSFATALRASFPELNVESWSSTYGELFQAVALEKSMMFVLLLLVVAIAAFNIIAGQSMMVNDKRASIAILRTMGLRSTAIQAVFLLQGLVISVTGTLLGIGLGLLAAMQINELLGAIASVTGMHLLDGSFFVTVPTLVLPSDLLIIAVISCGLCLASAWIPARKAVALDPIQGLHG